MMQAPPAEPPFDPRWLDLLAEVCGGLTVSTPRLQDLFMERRLELRISAVAGSWQAEEIRSDGAAARWRFPSRTALHARTGTSHTALEDLLSRHSRRTVVPRVRPIHPVEIDPPRQWREWAEEVRARATPGSCTIRFLARRAVVVRPERWTAIASPLLVRVELDGSAPAALLAVWRHPQLAAWLGDLFAPAPNRRWRPASGLQVPVLLSNGTAGVLLHELVGHLAESDLVLSGDSPLAQLAGASITAPPIRIVDDPCRGDLPGAFSCDDEGTVAAPLELVRGGQLVGWLCDRAGARRLGGAGGRGRRSSWDRPPVPRLSNLIVSAGDAEPDEIQRSLAEGLVVTRLGGATADPVTGRVVLRVERGWEVRHGRRRRAVEPFELTGGALDVLAHIEPVVGCDPVPDWRLGWCVKDGLSLPTGSESPSLLVHRLEVL
jgi:hypothetical protein